MSDDGKMTPCSCNYSRLFQVVIVSYKTCTNCSGIKLIWEASGRIFFFREAGAKVIITTAKHEVIFTSLLKEINILVQYCRTDTTREWLDTTCTTRTTRTGRETMVYGLYRSWINGDMHIISNTALQPRRYDPYESYDSYGS